MPSGGRGGGAAFMQLQFYPPGHAPFVDSISCDNAHRCAALTIDSPGLRATATSGRLVALGQARPGPGLLCSTASP
jgi:hypothetical protein